MVAKNILLGSPGIHFMHMRVNAKRNDAKKEIASIANLATTTALNAKINKVKTKIPNITNLATTVALTAVENKVPNVSNLVKKPDYNTI